MSCTYHPLSDELYAYAIAQRTDAEDPVLAALRAETESMGTISEMSISPDQVGLLTLLASTIGARYAVEIGTFTGASSIAIARGLVNGGKLMCFEQEFRYTTIARRYWMRAGVQEKIDLRLGDARTLVPHFRPPGPIDFVFIDADKDAYNFYFETLFPHVRPGGLFLFDNMLMGGKVINPLEKHSSTVRAIDGLNYKLSTDPRVESVLLPIADGLQVCRKR